MSSAQASPAMGTTQLPDLLIELGCEEIPAGVVPVVAQALSERLVALLDTAGIAHGGATWLGSPRRLTAHVAEVAVQAPDRQEVLTGPPARAARDPQGNWTQAALGFARGQGVEVDALEQIDTPKGPYLAARKVHAGRPTAVVLADGLPDLLRNLPFPKRMRWGREREPFVRPLHWIVALLGEAVVDVTFAGVRSGNLSRGHRFYHPGDVTVTADLAAYKLQLQHAKVLVDPADRQRVILRGLKTLAAEVDASWREDLATLDTVTYLVEWPAPLLGQFDKAFLEIPPEVIFTTLRENQKLFTLNGPDGRLMDRFVAVANTLSEDSRATVAAGNARVVSARLSDARFFYREDTKAKLETRVPTLADRIYLQGLGTIRDKVSRIEGLSAHLAARLCPDQIAAVERAALLCKADLATRMVFEFPELQGIIGGYYARVDGEPDAVAQAIAQHYQPRFAADDLPGSVVGTVLALADKLDAIVGCFALGLQPSGTQDPYALRRAALGVLRILAEGEQAGQASVRPIELGELIHLSFQQLPAELRAPAGPSGVPAGDEAVLAFFRGRLASMFAAQYPADLVEAVLDAGFQRVDTIAPRLRALDALRSSEGFAPLAAAFKRVGNIVRKQGGEVAEGVPVEPSRLQLEAERLLHAAVLEADQAVQGSIAAGDWRGALQHLVVIKPAVDGFFDAVMVMTDDTDLRRNRLALLRACAGLFSQIADFARIQA